MNVKILFFGAVADAAGMRELSYRTNAPDTTAMLAELLAEYPKLAGRDLLLALNQEHAAGSERLKDGDEVAIFAAVSGG